MTRALSALVTELVDRKPFQVVLPSVATALLLTLTQPASALNTSAVVANQNVATLGTTSNPPVVPPRPPETVPMAPILSSRWKTQSQVMLDYVDVSLVEAGFRMEQRRPGGPWQVLATLSPLGGRLFPGTFRASGLEPRTDYCFRLVAFNARGQSPASEVCVRTTYRGACEETTLEAVLAPATSRGDSVEISCDLFMEPHQVVTKRLVFVGSRASGVTVDLNGATLSGGDGTQNDGFDMIEVHSEEVVKRDDANAIST